MRNLFPIFRRQFDLKNAIFRIKDGYSATVTINLTAGYSVGAASFAVDGFTGFLRKGQQFTLTGSSLTHTITGVTDNSTTTTAITFTPATDVAVANDDTFTVGPHRLEVALGEGDLSYTERVTREYTRNRGVLNEVRNGDEEPLEINFDFIWEFILGTDGNDDITVHDALKKVGGASDWVTSDADVCRPYAVDLELDYSTVCGANLGEIIIFPDFRYEELNPQARDGVVTCTGRCNVTEPTVTRSS